MKSEEEPTVNEAVRELRLALGESQEAFAQRLNTSVRTVSRYETVRPPRGKLLAQFSQLARKENLNEIADLFDDALARELYGNTTEKGVRSDHNRSFQSKRAYYQGYKKNDPDFLIAPQAPPAQQSRPLRKPRSYYRGSEEEHPDFLTDPEAPPGQYNVPFRSTRASYPGYREGPDSLILEAVKRLLAEERYSHLRTPLVALLAPVLGAMKKEVEFLSERFNELEMPEDDSK